MVTKRIQQITAANEDLLTFLPFWEEYRHLPDTANFAFGNPQEMVVEGFTDALVRATVPIDKDHYAYKFSEEPSRAKVARLLSEWRGQEFDPADIAMTPGAFGAIAVALTALVDIGDEVVYFDPSWFFYESMILAAGATPVAIPVR
jgi:aspartate aminotransferase